MLGKLEITKIKKKQNKITVFFSFGDDWAPFLNSNSFKCTYEKQIESVPDGIAVIPTICNLLPIAWVYNLEIIIPELDEVFYKSLPKILDGYKLMYPDFDFEGNIVVKKIVKNKYDVWRNAVLFSGGVDATTTAFRHMEEKPDIVTVFGSDIKLTDVEGIRNVNKFNSNFCEQHGLNYEKIYSTFREFLNEKNLQNTEKLLSRGFGWWHEFQHGIGLIGLVAPIAFTSGYKIVYIASSYHSSQWGKYTCASDPTIDDKLCYGMTSTIHDGYEMTRQDKIKYICDYAKERGIKPYLRVCWESSGGKNCCHCEKCRRTYLAILAEKYNPNDFGLSFSKRDYKRMIRWYKEHLPYNFNMTVQQLYPAIQDAFCKNYDKDEMPKDLDWIRTIKFGQGGLPYRVIFKDKIKEKLASFSRGGQ